MKKAIFDFRCLVCKQESFVEFKKPRPAGMSYQIIHCSECNSSYELTAKKAPKAPRGTYDFKLKLTEIEKFKLEKTEILHTVLFAFAVSLLVTGGILFFFGTP